MKNYLLKLLGIGVILSSAAVAGSVPGGTSAVPEPESILLLGTVIGAIGFVGWKARKKKS